MELHDTLTLKAALKYQNLIALFVWKIKWTKFQFWFLSNNINQVYHWTTFPCSLSALSSIVCFYYYYFNLIYSKKGNLLCKWEWNTFGKLLFFFLLLGFNNNNVGISWPRNVSNDMQLTTDYGFGIKIFPLKIILNDSPSRTCPENPNIGLIIQFGLNAHFLSLAPIIRMFEFEFLGKSL